MHHLPLFTTPTLEHELSRCELVTTQSRTLNKFDVATLSRTYSHRHPPPLLALERVATHTPQLMVSRTRPSFVTFRARGPTRTPRLLIARSPKGLAMKWSTSPISIIEKNWPMCTAQPYVCAGPCNPVVHMALLLSRAPSATLVPSTRPHALSSTF
jgi:hypothetical protein